MNDISSLHTHRTIIDRLRHWRAFKPDAQAYTFLKDRCSLDASLTYAQLHDAVAARAADLLARDLEGQRVMIVLPSGLEYVVSFLACLAAGVVAVPMYSPSTRRDWDKLASVAANCKPKAVLANSKDTELIGPALDAALGSQRVSIIVVDAQTAQTAHPSVTRHHAPDPFRELDSARLAFLQYTSGSTGQPKGVMVSHANILHNAAQQASAMRSDERSIHISWLPLHHDMGLIGIVLQALSLGSHAVLMSPFSFLRRPDNWLRAISEYAGTISGAPNFAYDLCVDKIADAEIDTLDLSSWRTAFNGSEQIRPATLERFTKRFSRAGFRADAFFPCYGLAEATLYVSGAHLQGGTAALTLERAALAAGQAVPVNDPTDADAGANAPRIEVASVHVPPADLEACVVDAATWKARADGTVGEIWLKGSSIAGGYWERPAETAETFRAYLADTGKGPFLRTGDLGFRRDGRLYITGRVKELVIINGVNHYPQDIEATAEALGDPLRAHSSAAFAMQDERLAIVQGLDRTKLPPAELEATIEQIRRVVWDVHGIAPSFVGLVQPGEIAKTSSGKIQRSLIARRFTDGELNFVASWAEGARANEATAAKTAPEALAIIDWIKDYFPRRVNSLLIDERRTIPPYVVLDLGNRGLLGMIAPRTAGGLGLRTTDFLRVLETLGAKDMTIALFVGLNNALGIRPIALHGSTHTQARHLGSLALGRELGAFALTEPGAGSNPGAISATAQRMADGSYRLNGTKYWSGSAAWAGVINVFAKTLDAQGRVTGVTGFAIAQDSPGLRHGPEALTMGMRGMIQNTVWLENVPASAQQVLGDVDHGMRIAQDTLCYGRLAIAAVCIGAAKRCYRMMLRYAERREIATGRLIANPHAQTTLTDAMYGIATLERLVADTAARVDAGLAIAPEVLAACKCLSTEWLWKIVDATMQMMGGRGYIESNPIAQVFRDARIFRIFEGPTEALHHFLGTSLQRMPDVIRSYLSGLATPDESSALLHHFDQAFEPPQHDRASGDSEVMNLRASAAGAHVCELIFYAAGCAVPSVSRTWLDERLAASRHTFERTTRLGSSAASIDTLSAFAHSVDAQVGLDYCAAPYPDHAVDAWLAPEPLAIVVKEPPPEPAAVASPGTPQRSNAVHSAQPADIADFITDWITRRCAIAREATGLDIEFAMLGLSSIDSSSLAESLSERFSVDLDPTVFWNYPNTRELAHFVHSRLA
ncbi:AMP-binding protein [Trinickia sp. LjRoot230]|uniref:AMP-binding protein n=1 Tax=Trinickia sp. LjRoot230 TaxID=3342288 RepID=UPI003ECCE32C